MKKTKIICTLGPAVDDEEKLRELIENGMDCARFNFSHGSHEEQHARMERLRRVREAMGTATAILLDTKGPEIRLKNFTNGSVVLKEGQTFVLDEKENDGDSHRIGITYAPLAESLTVGNRLLIDDGKIELEVIELEGRTITCRVVTGGTVSNHKGINVPGVDITMPYISRADRDDILFGIEEKVDFIACSFVRSAGDVLAVRRLLQDHGGEEIKLISKIENMQGYQNLDEILQVSDGIMVARGDLGVEVPFEKVPSLQKNMIARCAVEGKIAITATQMLDSMIHAARPTRAEVSDVANAIYDGTAAVMLSGETAAGAYPVEAVRAMADIARYTEVTIRNTEHTVKSRTSGVNRLVDCVCLAARQAADFLNARAIVTVSLSGRTAFHLANYRPGCPIIAMTFSEIGYHQLSLAHGVLPVTADKQDSVEALLEYAKEKAKQTGLVQAGDTVILVLGSSTTSYSVVDTLKICEL